MLILRGLWSLFVTAMVMVGVIVANYAAGSVVRMISTPDGDPDSTIFFRIGIHLLGGLTGFLFGLIVFRKLISWAGHMEAVPLLDKVSAVIGVMIGLVVAILATTPFANLPGLGLPIRIFACVVGVLLGIGFAMSAKEQIVYIFPGLAPGVGDGHAFGPGARAKMLDTNIIIDGRVADITAAGFLDGPIVIPGFVLQELRHIAGSADGLKRARGRRGLDMLNRLNQLENTNVVVFEDYPTDLDVNEEVDQRLVSLANLTGATVVTNDYSVNEIAKLKSVSSLNVNELAAAMKPVYLPGEDLAVNVVKQGKEAGQGVGYLDDGTMVVVEGGANHINEIVPVAVTSVLQTTAGKMIFSDIQGDDGIPAGASAHRKKRDKR